MANISNIRAVGNPQRAYEWEFELFGNTTSGSLPLLTERAQNVTIPATSVETIEINYKSRKAMYAGRDAEAHSFTVTFWDSEYHDVYNFFKNWINNGISDTEIGGGVTRDLYAVEAVVKKQAHNSTSTTGSNRFTHVFPTELGDITLNYDSSEHITFDVNFSYDSNIWVPA